MKALVLFMYGTAARFGEAHRLEWSDINFKENTVRIRDTKTRKLRDNNIQTPLVVALANLPRDKAPFYWSESSLRRFFEEDVAKTAEAVPDFERLTFHCFRHGFATVMMRRGVDAKTAAELGGWADMDTFMKTYVRADRDKKRTDVLFGTPSVQRKTKPTKSKGWQK